MHGVGNERVIGKLLGILFFRVMQVDTPGTGYASVWKIPFGNDILFVQNYVPEQTSGLARTTDVGNPGKFGVLVLIRSVSVLHCIESSKDSPQVPVPNSLRIAKGILIVSAFPKPLPVEGAGIRKVCHV